MSNQPAWIAHVDLTSLDRTKESTASITTLAHTASRLNTACVCVYSERVVEAKSASPSIAVATVVNFPDGSDSQSAVVAETVKAVESGATEIDVVWNYKAYKDGDVDAAVAPVKWVAQAVKDKSNVQIKVILESGAIEPSTFWKACDLVLAHFDDAQRVYYLKTSTGKNGFEGATIESATTILEAIKAANKFEHVGLKVSGGVRTVEQAEQYYKLAQSYGCKHFRIGASSLLDGF